MSGETLLKVDRLSKLYARRDSATRRRAAMSLLSALVGAPAPPIRSLGEQEFWALKDVSLELRQGEAIGVIGLNGSGKTTLLRILAGQTLPDEGEVRLMGSSAAMIDLQAGFQPGASGRRNIFLRAAALGFTKRETLEMEDEIIAFSELGAAIDAPFSTYSSGMKMRLAFAVMAMVRPDVLLIDEVLAVGDFRFRQKCLSHIREMRKQSAFVFVSHSMGDVARFCDRAIVMHKGELVFHGAPDDAIAFYQQLEQDSQPTGSGPKSLIPATVDRPDLVENLTFTWVGTTGPAKTEIFEGDPLCLRVSFDVCYKPRNLVVGVPIYDTDANVLTGFATDASGLALRVDTGDHVELEMNAPHSHFNPGQYRAAIGVTDGTEFLNMRELPNLVVRPKGGKSWGVISVPSEWRATITSKQNANV